MKIYHNPRCRKSRETLAIIREKGIEPEIIEYLKLGLSEQDLKTILGQLGMQAIGLVRKSEPLYKDVYNGKSLTNDEWIRVLSENPILIERPIVVQGAKAVLGRPPEKVHELF